MENGICECIECGSLHAPGAQYGNTPELAHLAAEVEELKDVAERVIKALHPHQIVVVPRDSHISDYPFGAVPWSVILGLKTLLRLDDDRALKSGEVGNG